MLSSRQNTNAKDNFLADHVVRLAETSWKMEMDRYSSLLSSSGRLLTSVSIFSVALLTLLPSLLHESSFIKVIVFEYAVIFVFILGSFVLALIAQYRFKYEEILSPESLSNHVFEEKKLFKTAGDSARQFAGILEQPYKSIRSRNARLSRLLKGSTICLFVAIGFVVLFGTIDAALLLLK